VTEVRISTQSQASFLQRMGVLFADPLRERIVTELYMREMSPSGFHAEFGGGSVPRVDRHFKRLAEHGWLTFVRSESGGHRRGSTEHFYRTTELAVVDNETWSQLPNAVKAAFSRRNFEQLAERVRGALQAGTFDARPDRHLSWTPLLLDRLGWERAVAAVDGLFESLFAEQADARRRILESGEKPIPATIALAAFESPSRYRNAGKVRTGADSTKGADSPIPLALRLSKVFADPLCLKIVAETNLREMSAGQFHERFGEATISGIRRRFKMLAEIGWLRKVDQKTGGRRRGATEYFYRATGPAIFDSDTWMDVPDSIKTTYSWRTFEQLSEQVKEAIEAGTFDARPDSHFSWWLLRLDQLGWEKIIAAVDALFAFIFEAQEDAKLRMSSSGEKPITATLALAAFESPQDSVKAP
jgi:DNA-binding transcriptional ArsR family regulator